MLINLNKIISKITRHVKKNGLLTLFMVINFLRLTVFKESTIAIRKFLCFTCRISIKKYTHTFLYLFIHPGNENV